MPALKNPEIPILPDYNNPPKSDFWKKFPSKKLPVKPTTKVDYELLDKIIDEKADRLIPSVWYRAKKAVNHFKFGGPSYQLSFLPACSVKNSTAAITHGKYITDNLASWIKKGFVSGPFSSPPLENFRSNSILAVPQPGKVRICMNVSLPEGASFNDNIIPHSLEKIRMTSAKNFSFSILESGKGALMSKFDFIDAYKMIPARLQDLRLQGFSWLGKYFTENSMTFGGEPSVQNFDIAGATAKDLTLIDCNIPAKLVHRQLDDVPLVAPKNSGWCEEFSEKYRTLCDDINMALAPDCPKKDKAFTCSTTGKVLGIKFDTNTLSWKLPRAKKKLALAAIKSALDSNSIHAKQLQKLMGRLNHVSQMCPFLNGFRDPLNKDLSRAISAEPKAIIMSIQAKKDLHVWANFLLKKNEWTPIAHPRSSPPLCTKFFVSDAAGVAKNSKRDGKIGIGLVGLNEKSDTMLTFQLFWPETFIEKKRDKNKKRFGNKTCTLEAIGVLLPFLLIPDKLKNQHIICGVDNMGVVFGWANKKLKRDTCASILIRALHVIEAYLGSVIHVVHVPRVSNWESETADNLSRERTTGFLEKQMLSRTGLNTKLEVLSEWFINPTEDWTLADRLLLHVVNTCENKK